MTEKMTPSRRSDYAAMYVTLLDRDPLVCFLCGERHTRSAAMQVDYVVPPSAGGKFVAENLVLACKPCAKRRNQKPLSVYWQQRLVASRGEATHITALIEDPTIMERIRAATAYAPRIQPVLTLEGLAAEAKAKRMPKAEFVGIVDAAGDDLQYIKERLSGWSFPL